MSTLNLVNFARFFRIYPGTIIRYRVSIISSLLNYLVKTILVVKKFDTQIYYIVLGLPKCSLPFFLQMFIISVKVEDAKKKG